MSIESLFSILIIFGVLALVIKAVKSPSIPFHHPDSPRTREQLRNFILGKAKRTVIRTNYGFTTNNAENSVIGLKDRYQFGKMFEMASKSPDGVLPLGNGDRIAPHSREHGLSAGRSADQLRINILKEYGIDIATMEDLEVGDEEFIAQRKAELIAQIRKGMNQPDNGPDDNDGFPTEG